MSVRVLVKVRVCLRRIGVLLLLGSRVLRLNRRVRLRVLQVAVVVVGGSHRQRSLGALLLLLRDRSLTDLVVVLISFT